MLGLILLAGEASDVFDGVRAVAIGLLLYGTTADDVDTLGSNP